MNRQQAIQSYSPKVSLSVYAGPLDLLLSLIKKNKINIYDIPVAEITRQYLEAIGMDENDVSASGTANYNLDSGGDFIVMAAQLIYIKSSMLLPEYGQHGSEDEENGGYNDPRAELADMLIEYQKVKEVAGFLNNRPILGRDVFSVKIFKGDEAVSIGKKNAGNGVMEKMDILTLSRYFYNKIKEMEVLSNKYEVEIDRFSVKEKIIEIMESLLTSKSVQFGAMAGKSSCLDELFTYFLALLEMVRLALVEAYQEKPFQEIYIRPLQESRSSYLARIKSMN